MSTADADDATSAAASAYADGEDMLAAASAHADGEDMRAAASAYADGEDMLAAAFTHEDGEDAAASAHENVKELLRLPVSRSRCRQAHCLLVYWQLETVVLTSIMIFYPFIV
jgi:hypothetical protein